MLRVLAVLLLLAQPAGAEVILCIGDSITQGQMQPRGRSYPKHLQALLPADLVLNRGLAADVSSNEARFLAALQETKPNVMIIQYGTNDMMGATPLTASQSVDHLRGMATAALQAGARVYLITPPPVVCKLPACERESPDVYAQQARRNEGTAAIARELLQAKWPSRVRVLDLRSQWARLDGGWSAHSDDAGLHPNGAGYRLMAEWIARAIIADRRTPHPEGSAEPGGGRP